jgi:hypothetical protein
VTVSGGPGADTISVVFKNGWLNPAGGRLIDGLTAGYDDDRVNLTLGGRTLYLLDISGAERDTPLSSREGLAARLLVRGPADPASALIKFEVRTVRAADDGEVDTDAAIAEHRATGEWVDEDDPDPAAQSEQLFLPVVAVR